MKLIDMTCPHCGAQLKIDADRKEAYCEHCGAQIIIDDEVRHVHYDNAEEAGYQFEKGRQRAQLENCRKSDQQIISSRDKDNKPRRKHTLLWALGWLLIFPLPITILLFRNKRITPKVKYGIIASAWVLYLLIGILGNYSENKDNKEGVNLSIEDTASADATAESNVYADDSVVNAFIEAYNSFSASPISNIEKGNIRTKYFGDSYGYYCEFLHANDTGKILVTINETNDNAELGIAGMGDVFKDTVKAIDNSIADEDIDAVFNEQVQYTTYSETTLGNMICRFHKDVDLSGGRSRGRIEIEAQ